MCSDKPKRTAEDNVASALAVATCSLLGAATVTASAQEEERTWDFNTSLLYYGESDDRVQDMSLGVLAQRAFADERLLTMSLSIDSLTGASASGAIALDTPQTFTSPSGNATYTTLAGDVPLDSTFLDTRYALTANWSQPFGEQMTMSAGLGASVEYDYVHAGANVSLARNFNRNNTTLSAGLALARDTWDPVGGAPIGLAQMLPVGDLSNRRAGDQDKDVVDLLLGVTQVINRNAVMQLSYSYSDASGYLNDPYKIISVVDGATGDTLSVVPPAEGGPDGLYRFENRPDSRTKHSLFSQLKYYLGGHVLDASYRFMTDDWGIDSHTVDLHYRVPLSAFYVEPHLRFYNQSAADFYRSSLIDGVALPEHASADFRLGEFDAVTAGVKIGKKLDSGNEWSVRLEYYTQRGNVPAEQIIGNQAGRVQYPGLDAIIVQFGYRFGF